MKSRTVLLPDPTNPVTLDSIVSKIRKEKKRLVEAYRMRMSVFRIFSGILALLSF
jgi:hypothetical protein